MKIYKCKHGRAEVYKIFLRWLKSKLCNTKIEQEPHFKIHLPEDFESKLNKRILLTGAGFSHCYGMPLTSTLNEEIFNNQHSSIQAKEKILDINGNYEDVYASLPNDMKNDFENAIMDIFEQYDSQMNFRHSPKPNISDIANDDIQEQFFNIFFQEDSYNILITLNQDLVHERAFLTLAKKRQSKQFEINEAINLHYPYNNYCLSEVVTKTENYNGYIQRQTQDLYKYNDFNQVIKFEPSAQPRIGSFNLIKAHGSTNWSHSEGQNILITGRDKKNDIQKFNALLASKELLKQISQMKDIVLVIFGYSFSDEHINKIICDICKKNGKLIVIDTKNLNYFKNELANKPLLINNEENISLIKDALARGKYFSGETYKYVSENNQIKELENAIQNCENN